MQSKGSKVYAEKLRDPRWQKKRLEVLNRDSFTCLLCGDKETTLVVHHRYYIWGRDPWDYPDCLLATLCQPCHEGEHEIESIASDFTKILKGAGLFHSDLVELADGFRRLNSSYPPSVVSSVISWAISNPEILRELEARYFDSIKQQRPANGIGEDG